MCRNSRNSKTCTLSRALSSNSSKLKILATNHALYRACIYVDTFIFHGTCPNMLGIPGMPLCMLIVSCLSKPVLLHRCRCVEAAGKMFMQRCVEIDMFIIGWATIRNMGYGVFKDSILYDSGISFKSNKNECKQCLEYRFNVACKLKVSQYL